MVNRIELETLLSYLRYELEQIDEAIVALERMALRRNFSATEATRPISSRSAGRSGLRSGWSSHHIRTDL